MEIVVPKGTHYEYIDTQKEEEDLENENKHFFYRKPYSPPTKAGTKHVTLCGLKKSNSGSVANDWKDKSKYCETCIMKWKSILGE